MPLSTIEIESSAGSIAYDAFKVACLNP